MSLEVVAVHLRCNLCDRNVVYEPLNPGDPLNPAAVPDGWRAFADVPGGRSDRHWCPKCVEFVDRYQREAVAEAVEARKRR